MIKPAYSVSFLLSINIFVLQNVLYFLDAPRISSSTNPTRPSLGSKVGHFGEMPATNRPIHARVGQDVM